MIKTKYLIIILLILITVLILKKYYFNTDKNNIENFYSIDWQKEDLQTFKFVDSKQHTYKSGTRIRFPTAKFWVSSYEPFNTKSLQLDNMYNTVELLGEATRVIVCKKNWNEIKDHNTDKNCQVITTKGKHIIFGGKHDLSSLKVFPENNPKAMVKVSGRKPDGQRPEHFYIYYADKLSWKNNIKNILTQGNVVSTLYQKDNYKGRSQVHKNGEIEGKMKKDTDSIQVRAGPSPIRWEEEWDKKDEESNPIVEVEYPYVKFHDKKGKVPSDFIFKLQDIEYLDMDNTYNHITLKNGAKKVIVCDKNWYEGGRKDGHEKKGDCKVITDTSPTGVILFEGRHKLSSLRIVDPPNPEQVGAYVTLSGKKQGEKKNRPDSIDVYKADKLDWENEIDSVDVHGNIVFKMCDEYACKDNDSGLKFDRRSRNVAVPRDKFTSVIKLHGQKQDEEEEMLTLEGEGDMLHVTLYDRTPIEPRGDMRIELRVKGSVQNLDLNDTYEHIELGDNVEEVVLGKKDYKDLKKNTGCYNSNSDSFSLCDDVIILRPSYSDGREVRKFKIQFRGNKPDLSYVQITKKTNPALPAFVKLFGRNDGKIEQPVSIEIAHADFLNWKNKHIKYVIGHNRNFYLYDKTKLRGRAIPVNSTGTKEEVKYNDKVVVKEFESLSLYPPVKLNSVLTRKLLRKIKDIRDNFVTIFTESSSNNDSAENVIMPIFEKNAKKIVTLTNLNLKNKYKYLTLENGCSKAKIIYGNNESFIIYDKQTYVIQETFENIHSIEVLEDGINYYENGVGYVKLYERLNKGDSSIPHSIGIRKLSNFDLSNKNLSIDPNDWKISVIESESNMLKELSKENINNIGIIKTLVITDVEVSNFIKFELFTPSLTRDKEISLDMKKIHEQANNLYATPPVQTNTQEPKQQGTFINNFTIENFEDTPSYLFHPQNKATNYQGFSSENGNNQGFQPQNVSAPPISLVQPTVEHREMIFNPPEEMDNLDLGISEGVIHYNKLTFNGGTSKVKIGLMNDNKLTYKTLFKTSGEFYTFNKSNIYSIEVIEDGDDGYDKGNGYVTLIRDDSDKESHNRPRFFEVRKVNLFNWKNKDFTVSGKDNSLVFYGDLHGKSSQKIMVNGVGTEFQESISNMSSMYLYKINNTPQVFFKRGSGKKMEYMQFVGDTDIKDLNLNDTYNQFKFGGGAGKVQLCTKEWSKIKDKCYSKEGSTNCKDCKVYEIDPMNPDRTYSVLLPKNDLSSLRVIEDGYKGFEENSGYVELMGKKSSKKSQPDSIKIRNADRLDWNDKIETVYNPDKDLHFYKHNKYAGKEYVISKSDYETPVKTKDGKHYSSLRFKSGCEESEQDCHECEIDVDCSSSYTSNAWKDKYYRDGAQKNETGGYDAKCINGTCVACDEHSDCSSGYECCTKEECNNWKTNKVYGACHLAEKQESKPGLFGTSWNPVDFVAKTVTDVANFGVDRVTDVAGFGVNKVSDVAGFGVNKVSDVAKFGYSNTVGSIVNKKSSKEKKEQDIQINKTINSVKWVPIGN